MSFLRDHFGGKKYFSEMDDEQLMNHLADIVLTGSFFCGQGVHSMLSVVFDRVSASKEEHSALLPVAREMARLERDTPNYSIGSIYGALAHILKDRYADNNKPNLKWQSLLL